MTVGHHGAGWTGRPHCRWGCGRGSARWTGPWWFLRLATSWAVGQLVKGVLIPGRRSPVGGGPAGRAAAVVAVGAGAVTGPIPVAFSPEQAPAMVRACGGRGRGGLCVGGTVRGDEGQTAGPCPRSRAFLANRATGLDGPTWRGPCTAPAAVPTVWAAADEGTRTRSAAGVSTVPYAACHQWAWLEATLPARAGGGCSVGQAGGLSAPAARRAVRGQVRPT